MKCLLLCALLGLGWAGQPEVPEVGQQFVGLEDACPDTFDAGTPTSFGPGTPCGSSSCSTSQACVAKLGSFGAPSFECLGVSPECEDELKREEEEYPEDEEYPEEDEYPEEEEEEEDTTPMPEEEEEEYDDYPEETTEKPKEEKPKAKEAKDKYPKCCEWAKAGECESNRFWMMPNCQKACGTPGARPWNVASMKAKVSEECGAPDAAASTPTPAQGDSTPAPTDPAASSQAPPPTGQDPKPSPSCQNKEDSCQGWAARGECTKNPDYMHVHCASSCNTCPSPPDPNCDDNPAYPLCKYWAKTNECSRNEGFMHNQCKKSCGLCGATPSPGAPTTAAPNGGPTSPASPMDSTPSGNGFLRPDGKEVQGTLKLDGKDVPFVIRLINGRRRRVFLRRRRNQ